ncbi:hypothetical protein [Nocardia sp. MDA0666]|uniref:hypothetical protein n=1 Tax=Nocardia sp. MDA0666 TaxID=2135448 RepID=UPI0011B1FF12|nr:hypothetical protein [Nocardia sp. MDA0666]
MSKHLDPNFQFGIIMPLGTPAIVPDAGEPGEPEVKSTEPPSPGMLPVHWNTTCKCRWESPDDLLATVHPDVRERMDDLRAQHRRDTMRLVAPNRKRDRNPSLTVSVDSELKDRVEQALNAVDSTYKDHVLAFLRWFIRETDELPSRPDYRIPYFPYGE